MTALSSVWGVSVLMIVSVGLLIATGVLAWRATRLQRQQAHCVTQWQRQRQAQAEAKREAEALGLLADMAQLAEATVKGGTLTVASVHESIAAIPFEVLQAIPATRYVATEARAAHHQVSSLVYGLVLAANQLVGKGLRDVIGDDASKSKTDKRE